MFIGNFHVSRAEFGEVYSYEDHLFRKRSPETINGWRVVYVRLSQQYPDISAGVNYWTKNCKRGKFQVNITKEIII